MFQDECSRNNRPIESDKALGYIETSDGKLQLAKEEDEVIKTASGTFLKGCFEVVLLTFKATGKLVKVFTPKDRSLIP